MKPKERIRYDCEENDNHFYLKSDDDGNLDELHIGDPLEKLWTVIGIKDLEEGLNKVGYTIKAR